MFSSPSMGRFARRPYTPSTAVAIVEGSPAYSDILGKVRFTQNAGGVLLEADVDGLPQTPTGFFAFYLHERFCGDPGPDPSDYFPESGGHYNLGSQSSPCHLGDFPPLLRTGNGSAHLSFLTDRFSVRQAIGRAVVIHLNADDFGAKTAVDDGPKIACGTVMPGTKPRRRIKI